MIEIDQDDTPPVDETRPQCPLCQQRKREIARSHVIPDYHYRRFWDSDRKILKISVADRTYVQRRETGEWEYMLCYGEYGCEETLNENYERDVHRFFDETRFDPGSVKMGELFEVAVDTGTFRLYLLSILWKASRSKQEFFKNITLNTEADELIRNFVLGGYREEPDRIPILMQSVEMDGGWHRDLILQPLQGSANGTDYVVFVFGGFSYVFLLHELDDREKWAKWPFIGFSTNLQIRRLHINQILNTEGLERALALRDARKKKENE